MGLAYCGANCPRTADTNVLTVPRTYTRLRQEFPSGYGTDKFMEKFARVMTA